MNIKNENKPVGGDEGDNASGSGGPGWLEACRREETIRKLLGRSEGERLKIASTNSLRLLSARETISQFKCPRERASLEIIK